MRTSKDIKELAAALHKAQGIMGGAKKASTNPFFKSKYSDLSSVMQAISIPFFDNGLSFVQGAEYQDGFISVVTRIMHASGQWIESNTMLPTVKNDPQAYGSAITYAKRFGLQALTGVPSIDDDGQYASASTQELAQEKKEVLEKTLHEMIVLIEKDDVAFTQIWHEMDRDEQSIVWKKINTKQKAAARKLLNQVKDTDNAVSSNGMGIPTTTNAGSSNGMPIPSSIINTK